MTSLNVEDFSAIHPAVVRFDQQNELLGWIADMSVGASKSDASLFHADKLEAYGDAVKIYRSREGKPLRDFMKLCGRIALQDEFNEGSALYEKAVATLVQNPEDEEARDQATVVIQRFSAKQSLAEFTTLYGVKKDAPSKLKTKRTTPKTSTPSAKVKIETPLEPLDEIVVPVPTEEEKKPSFTVTEMTIARDEITTAKEQIVSTQQFADGVNNAIKAFVELHGSEVTANRIYRYLESEFPGISREEARTMLTNIMAMPTASVYRAGAREGNLVVTSVPERAGALSASSNKRAKAPELAQPVVEEDLSKHELVLPVKIAVSKANRHKGISVKSLALELGVEEDEVRRIVGHLVDINVLIAEVRREGTGLSKSSTYKKLFRFPTPAALQTFKDSIA